MKSYVRVICSDEHEGMRMKFVCCHKSSVVTGNARVMLPSKTEHFRRFSMNKSMYKLRAAFFFTALALLSFYSFAKDKPKDATVSLHGAIVDSQCAFNVHSDAPRMSG